MAVKIKKLASWKKIVKGFLTGILIFIFTFFLGIALLFMYLKIFVVAVKFSKTEFSPNGLFKAVVYEYDCGATTGFSSDISIVPYYLDTPDDPGNVAIIEGHRNWNKAKVIWLDDRNLLIEYKSDWNVIKGDKRH